MRCACDIYISRYDEKTKKMVGGMEGITVSGAVSTILQDFVIARAFSNLTEHEQLLYKDSNRWRDERLYFKNVDDVFRENIVSLRVLYDSYSNQIVGNSFEHNATMDIRCVHASIGFLSASAA